jgi:hypothetical protein
LTGPVHRPKRHEITVELVFSFKNRRVAAGKELPFEKMADHLPAGIDLIVAKVGQVIVLQLLRI